jgi:hypothetical protein
MHELRWVASLPATFNVRPIRIEIHIFEKQPIPFDFKHPLTPAKI